MGEVPVAAGEEGAGGVGEDVARVAGGVGEQVRSDELGGERPGEEVERDLGPAGRRVVAAEVEFALNPERERERGGDQEEVIKITVEKRGVGVRVEVETVERVERARGEAERIEGVGETLHRSAAMRRPLPRARRSWSTKRGR